MSDNITDITPHILIEIRDTIRRMDAKLSDHDGEFAAIRHEMRTEFTAVRDEMRGMRMHLSERIDRTNDRIDNLIHVVGDRFRDHETRIGKLERGRRRPH